jgi:hypothetical protein
VATAIHHATCLKVDGQSTAPTGKFYVSDDLLAMLGDSSVADIISPRPRVDENGNATRDATGTLTVPVVVIDEVGQEKAIPYIGASAEAQKAEKQARLFRVIQYCYTYKIGMVITSNLKVSQLESLLGRAAWSRLQEMAPRGFILSLWEADGRPLPDWRVKAGGR